MVQTRPAQTRPALFISHSSKNKAWAMRLHNALVAEEYGAFLDSHPDEGIHPGAEWEKLLWQRLRQCGGVVVLCSANWLESPWCVAEAMIAREQGKTIFLLATAEVIVPDFLKDRQFISIAGLTDDQVLKQLWRGFEEEKLNEEFAVVGPPYPGLEPFQERDAAVFFGRRDEIESVKNMLKKRRLNNAKGFIVVLGASGCGKSSLVRAGVLRRLRRAGEEKDSTAEWVIVPPFFGHEGLEGLVRSFDDAFREADQPQTPQSLRQRLVPSRAENGEPHCDVRTMTELATDLLSARRLRESHILLVLDQLEEVFATKEDLDSRAMLRLLLDASSDPASRVVVLATMRSDFLDAFQKFEGAAERYEKITLDPMQKERFAEIIEGPADRCTLKLGPGLCQRMVEDTKYADALPLLAFTLKELYEKGGADNLLTVEEYEGLFPPVEVRGEDGTKTMEKGVAAAIKHVADTILENSDFAGVKADDPRIRPLREAFFRLAQVRQESQFTRRTARRQDVTASDAVAKVLEKFEKERLLVPGVDPDGAPTLSVAHEALFRVWDTLNGWLQADRKALVLRAQIEDAAAEWEYANRVASRAWAEERVLDAVRMIEDSGVSLDDVKDQATVDAFLGPTDPELLRMLPSLNVTEDTMAGSGRYGDAWRLPLSHEARASVGVRLALRGDHREGVGLCADGLPDIDWVDINGGRVMIEIRSTSLHANPNSPPVEILPCSVKSFRMARFPITIVQFQAFLKDYTDGKWRLPPGRLNPPGGYPLPKLRTYYRNYPAGGVDWYHARTFCLWLSARLGFEVRLPTESEWQLAATGGDSSRAWPWGADWDPAKEPWRANTVESGLPGPTAVGMYPAGASSAGVLDMAGTVYEWCSSPFDRSMQNYVLRGGSWINGQSNSRSAFRFGSSPLNQAVPFGFRVVCSSPSSPTDR